jgi:hypothetical protein
MSREVYKYVFDPSIDIADVEASLLLALLAAESLHGEAQVRLDAAHFLDPAKRACVIDAGTPVGRDINRLFVGFASREFGEDAFRVERVEKQPQLEPQEIVT